MNWVRVEDKIVGIAHGGALSLCKVPPGDIPRIFGRSKNNTSAIYRGAMMLKEWKFPSDHAADADIVKAAEGSEILATLLLRRGLSSTEEIRAFLDPAAFHPSSPSELPGMAKAVARIGQAIAQKEKITVYGDYDVDGVTATAVMVTTLRRLGADVDFYIPNRSEGYGLNLKAVSILASKHRTKLIVSCDCGISNFSEINFARSLGVDTIITDHHTMPELLPPAAAILHPKQLDEGHQLFHLPGVGVAYKLSEALFLDQGLTEETEKLLDFVTLGMIADMVPLTKECRYLVQIGMPKLVSSTRAGIKALLAQVSGRSEGTDLVGFGLAPRINAVGRLSDAMLAVKLMITEDADEASQLAKQLELENSRRQELCEQIFFKADQRAAQLMQTGDRAIAIFDSGWHHGVVGIVASRLVEKYHCPVFIGELDEKEGIVKGSARGIPGIDLYQVLKANEHLAMKWGGHKMAAGFSVEAAKAEPFCRALVDSCNRMLSDQDRIPTLEIDLVLPAGEITTDLAKVIAKMAPFGIANKKPLLAMRDQSCINTRALGKEGKHSRIMVSGDGDQQFECVMWNSRGRVPQDGQSMDVVFTPEINTYNGTSRLQLLMADWRDPYQTAGVSAVPAGSMQTIGANSVASSTTQDAGVAPPALHQPSGASSGQGGVPISVSQNKDVVAGSLPAGKEKMAPSPTFDARPGAREPQATQDLARASGAIAWKDLRIHAAPESLLHAAARKLGDTVSIFGESCPTVEGIQLLDRSTMQPAAHLLLWSYPPNAALFKQLLTSSGARNVYLVGGFKSPADDAPAFLKRLLGLVRYSVNQRNGQANPEKVAAALGTTKMAIALGLTILKKINLIDWFAEDGTVYLDIIGEPTGKAELLPDFKQLANCLKDIAEFRRWSDETPLRELQLALVSDSSSAMPHLRQAESSDAESNPQASGIPHHDTVNQLPANIER